MVGENTVFFWYDCKYFNPNSPAQDVCPEVILETSYSDTLNGYFGNKWEEPFKKWFSYHFELPIKTVG